MRKINERVSSLTEYISVIEKYDLRNQYFRGENRKYPSISSSLIREYTCQKHSIGLASIYSDLLSSYYQEVGYKLDRIQEENFLAFSQHHGLKTNLIDFTTAPLVALFFACEDVGCTDNSGFVYIINQEDTVDASEFFRKYSLKDHLCYNVFDQMANNQPDVVAEFRNLLEKNMGFLSGKNPFDLVKSIIELIRNYPQFVRSNDYLKERDLICKKGIDGSGDFYQLVKKYLPDYNMLGGTGVMEFIALFLLIFDDIRSLPIKIPPNIPFPQMPYFIYKTPLKFDRIRNQNGVFLYQAFINYHTELDQLDGLMIQEIIPNMIIQIDNQEKILDELDMIGINRKYIYGDFDNTAYYTNRKYFNINI